MPRKKQSDLLLVCDGCGVEFFKKASRYKESLLKGYLKHFCSARCSSSLLTQRRKQSEFHSNSLEKVMQKVDKTPGHGPNGDCWLWTGRVNSYSGYGEYNWKAKSVKAKGSAIRAHRLVFELLESKIPDNKILLHLCDVKLCCRPSHLRIGTHADNKKDLVDKSLHPKGARLTRYPHLTDEVVEQILIDSREGMPLSAVSKKYRIGLSCAKQIRMRKTWRHVTIKEDN